MMLQTAQNRIGLFPPKNGSKLGLQRDWLWRGWKIRYSFAHPQTADPSQTPILLLHGFGSALTQWHENILPLSQAHPVYALDLIGFGVSEKASTTYKVGLWVDQVYEFWRNFINCPIVLVGHSLGALVALTAAATYPDMVENLVLITLPAARQEILPNWLQPLVVSIEGMFTTPLFVRPLFKLICRPNVIRSVLQKVYVNPDRVTEALVESFLTPGYDQGAVRAFCRLAQARTQTDFSLETKDLLQTVTAPVLLLWGQQDRVIPIAWGRHLAETDPNLKLVEIPAAGHCPYDEAAEQVNAEILAWLTLRSTQ
jgi:pimeloyl-ACP methyl ester carboxylesterase